MRQALAAIGTLVRRGPTPEGEDGFTLFHHSFRAHVLASARTTMVVATAREALAELRARRAAHPAARVSVSPRRRPSGGGGPGRGRAGAAHRVCLRHGPAPGAAARRGRRAAGGLADPRRDRAAAGPGRATLGGLRPRARAPAAPRHARVAGLQDSPATGRRACRRQPGHPAGGGVAGQAGHGDWLWLRNPRRVAHAAPDPCLRVLEGHTGSVIGAAVLADGRILSWSGMPRCGCGRMMAHPWPPSRGTQIRSWGPWNWGRPDPVLVTGRHAPAVGHGRRAAGHPRGTHRCGGGRDLVLSDCGILSWSNDGTLRLWAGDGTPLATLAGHTGVVQGAIVLSDCRILSWSWDSVSGQAAARCASPLGR